MKELLKNEALFLMLEKVMGKKIGKDGIYKIQQAGQKYAGICYMDVADEFFYQCLSNTTSTVNDGALFKKIGVSENEDKLSNLIMAAEYNGVVPSGATYTDWLDLPFPKDFNSKNCLVLTETIGTTINNYWIVKLNMTSTKFCVYNVLGVNNYYVKFLFIRNII